MYLKLLPRLLHFVYIVTQFQQDYCGQSLKLSKPSVLSFPPWMMDDANFDGLQVSVFSDPQQRVYFESIHTTIRPSVMQRTVWLPSRQLHQLHYGPIFPVNTCFMRADLYCTTCYLLCFITHYPNANESEEQVLQEQLSPVPQDGHNYSDDILLLHIAGFSKSLQQSSSRPDQSIVTSELDSLESAPYVLDRKDLLIYCAHGFDIGDSSSTFSKASTKLESK